MIPEQVHRFQSTMRFIDGTMRYPFDWYGEPLRQDGDLGPKTRWALALSALDTRRQSIVWRACSSVGVLEEAPNRGKRIDEWLRRCGVSVPKDPWEPAPDNAWCAAFASWCVSVDGLPERREAGAQALGKALRASTLITPGDLAWFKTGTWQGHIGVIVGLGAGELAVVEGNQRNAVRLVRRLSKDVRISTPLPLEEMPGVPPGLELVAVQKEGTR